MVLPLPATPYVSKTLTTEAENKILRGISTPQQINRKKTKLNRATGKIISSKQINRISSKREFIFCGGREEGKEVSEAK